MTMYQYKLDIVITWCRECEWRVYDYHLLFQMMYNYSFYEKLKLNATSDETRERAADSLECAKNLLIEFLDVRCVPDKVKRAVWYLAKSLN